MQAKSLPSMTSQGRSYVFLDMRGAVSSDLVTPFCYSSVVTQIHIVNPVRKLYDAAGFSNKRFTQNRGLGGKLEGPIVTGTIMHLLALNNASVYSFQVVYLNTKVT